MKKTVVVMFGGKSNEHEISVITGLEVVNAIDTDDYNVLPLYIAQDGRWYCGDALRDKSIYKNAPESLKELPQVALLPIPGQPGLRVLNKKNFLGVNKEEFIPADVFLPAFHGQFGEDGCIQGLLELANVAYTSSSVTASAIAMDKALCKSVLKDRGIPSLSDCVVDKEEFVGDTKSELSRITDSLGSYPLFVKPVHLGSSIAVGKADNEQELLAALTAVFDRDYQAIVEPCVTDIMEINVSVMLTTSGYKASVVEIPVASDQVLTYEDKYMRSGGGKKGAKQESQGMAGLARVVDPQDLDPDLKKRVIDNALRSAAILKSAGIARYDFIYDTKKAELYFNELNPIPGSMAHYLWAKSEPNYLFTEIIDEIIKVGIASHAKKQRLKTDEGFRAL